MTLSHDDSTINIVLVSIIITLLAQSSALQTYNTTVTLQEMNKVSKMTWCHCAGVQSCTEERRKWRKGDL